MSDKQSNGTGNQSGGIVGLSGKGVKRKLKSSYNRNKVPGYSRSRERHRIQGSNWEEI